MKPLAYPEAALFCLAWVALAIAAWNSAGWVAGMIMSMGLLVPITAISAAVLSRTGSFRQERVVRWSILVLAGLLFLVWRDLSTR